MRNLNGVKSMEITNFLNTSYTAYHTVRNAENFLKSNGFLPLQKDVKIKKGGKYYIEKNGSAIIAFKVGNLNHYGFNVAMAHTDSPALRVKGRKLLDSPEGKRINVEAYGGLIRYSFMNIPLKIVGRLFAKTEYGLKTVLVESDFTVNLPSLCIHHNIEVNEKASLTVQNDMLPLIGGDCDDLYKILCPELEIVDGDLFVVPCVNAFYSGAKKEFLCSPRIDNLTSCYSILQGLVEGEPCGVSVCCLFDNEEIGSNTKQGAASAFLPDLLKKINDDLGMSYDDYLKAVDRSFLLSSDNGHAVHQAHPEKSDLSNKVYLNGGVVIKHHTNYATDGFSSAVLKAVFDKSGVKYQDYYNNSDIRCGGTLGLMVSTRLQMVAADIGLGQLAMHSSIETVGANDISTMTEGIKAFYDAKFDFGGEDIKLF